MTRYEIILGIKPPPPEPELEEPKIDFFMGIDVGYRSDPTIYSICHLSDNNNIINIDHVVMKYGATSTNIQETKNVLRKEWSIIDFLEDTNINPSDRRKCNETFHNFNYSVYKSVREVFPDLLGILTHLVTRPITMKPDIPTPYNDIVDSIKMCSYLISSQKVLLRKNLKPLCTKISSGGMATWV